MSGYHIIVISKAENISLRRHISEKIEIGCHMKMIKKASVLSSAKFLITMIIPLLI